MYSLHRASLIAALGAATVLLAPNFASAQLTNGLLNVNIDGAPGIGFSNNGGIFNLEFNGTEFYRQGTFVSDYGFQVFTDDTTFAVAEQDASTNPFTPTVIASPGVVTVTGIYSNSISNFSFTRTYQLVTGFNALQITTNVTNIGATAATLRFFEQYDPDQIGVNTIADTSGGIVTATNDAGGGDGLSVAASTNNAPGSITNFVSDSTFQVTGGTELNNFYDGTLQLDPNGAGVDTSFLFAFETTLGAGSSATYNTFQGFGNTTAEAQAALAGATGNVGVAAPEPGSVAFLALGALPFLGAVVRRRMNR